MIDQVITQSPVDRLLDALRAHDCQPKCSGEGWIARCPAHDDERPSLSFKAGDDGRVLVKCHAGCSTEDVVKALSLSMADLFEPTDNGRRGRGRIVATYDYHDEHGELLFQVCRAPPKRFWQQRPDGDGHWVLGLSAGEYVQRADGNWRKPKKDETGGTRRTFPEQRRVLYRLPKLTTSLIRSSQVFIVEGEKDADRLDAAGLVATCCPQGAGKWARLDDDSVLEGRPVVILPDADTAGRRHTEDVAGRQHGRAAVVKVVDLFPDRDDGSDVSDWLDAGGDPEDLDRLAAQAAEWEPGPPPAPTAYSSADESMRALRGMKKTATDARSAMLTLAEQAAEWFDRRGPETLGKEYPVAYAAKVVGVSRQHFYLLRDTGRVRRLLCGEVSSTDDTVATDRSLRPLTKLLPQRPDDIPAAFERACEWASIEGKAVNSRHTARSVKALLPSGDQIDPRRRLLRLIDRCLATATESAAPDGVLSALQDAQRLTYDSIQHEVAVP